MEATNTNGVGKGASMISHRSRQLTADFIDKRRRNGRRYRAGRVRRYLVPVVREIRVAVHPHVSQRRPVDWLAAAV
jgi:hypothetical protein